MRKSEEYRAKAEEFSREALRVTLDVHRQHYLTLAAAWRDLAAAAETNAALQVENFEPAADAEPEAAPREKI